MNAVSGRISQDFIDELIQRVDIVDLINSHIPLKKAGINYIARCPFHGEKTPSFSVTREKQFFYCFGCGATGNAITFMMEYGNLGFVEALEDIASFVGIELRTNTFGAATDPTFNLKPLHDFQAKVAAYYQDCLKQSREAIDYLKQRGLKGDIVKRYGIGFAPARRHSLCSKFQLELLFEAGLAVKSDTGDIYDRFRNRVMFPILDGRGRTIGFGGRVLDDSIPKYLNSPETASFRKGKAAYGLYELRQMCRKPERIVIVEGFLDVIVLAQHGIDYSVATLGTATSKDHIDLLFRSCSELVFCFDGDDAGQQAAWRALEVSLPSLREGRQIRFMSLPVGYDPDSLVREEGEEKFTERIKQASPLSDYFFQILTENKVLAGIEERTTFIEAAQPLLAKMPSGVYRDLMFNRLAELARVERVVLVGKSTDRDCVKKPVSKAQERIKPSAMRTAIALLLMNPALLKHMDAIAAVWTDSDLSGLKVLKRLAGIIQENPSIHSGAILERLRGLPEQQLIDKLIRWDPLIPPHGIEQEFKDSITRIREQLHREALEKLLTKARRGDLDEEGRKKMQYLLTISKT